MCELVDGDVCLGHWVWLFTGKENGNSTLRYRPSNVYLYVPLNIDYSNKGYGMALHIYVSI